LFQERKTVAILANKSSAAREVMYRYQIMYENLPIWMQQGVKTWNKGDVELENGSIVMTAATSASGIRGKSVNWLYIDEAAMIPNTIAEQFFTSVYPTISSGETTKILLSSTPLGYNHFWKFWNDAENDRNGFKPLFIPYWEIPGRTHEWADEQRALLGELKFNQEVLCKFLGSSNTLVSPDSIARMSAKQYEFSKDGLDILVPPVKENKYIISVDTSRGVGGDYSAFSVIDITKFPYDIVAKYRNNKISPLLYPDIIYKIAKDYNNAYCLVEVNDIGQQVADILYSDLEYENLFFTQTDNKIGSYITATKGIPGIRTTKQVKRVGCSVLKNLIENNKLLVADSDIISELSTFIEQRGSFQADEGYHDDLVMTLVLFAWLSNEAFFKDLTDTNLRKELFEAQSKHIEEELTPFGLINTGIKEEEKPEIWAGDLWFNGEPNDEILKMRKRWLESV